MKLLVTGKHGQVSTAIQERCSVRKDISLTVVGRPQIDLDKPSGIADFIAGHKPDIVLSAAAWTAVDHAESNTDAASRANGISAGEISRGAAMAGAPIIHLSTDYVFDGSKAGSWVESDPVNPLGVYGITKLDGEKLVALYNEKHVILRTAWVYSPFGNNFVKTMLRLAKTHNELSIVDDQYGCPTSAFDIADGILAVADNFLEKRYDDFYGVYHLAGTGTATWYDFAGEIFRQAKENGLPYASIKAVCTDDFPTKAKRPRNSRLNCSKFSQKFKFQTLPWAVALQNVIRKYSEEVDQ